MPSVPTPGMIDAVARLARTECLLLDPVYTGKAMAGLIDRAASGGFEPSDTVVFPQLRQFPAGFHPEHT